jgi:hypothetical protein
MFRVVMNGFSEKCAKSHMKCAISHILNNFKYIIFLDNNLLTVWHDFCCILLDVLRYCYIKNSISML